MNTYPKMTQVFMDKLPAVHIIKICEMKYISMKNANSN